MSIFIVKMYIWDWEIHCITHFYSVFQNARSTFRQWIWTSKMKIWTKINFWAKKIFSRGWSCALRGKDLAKKWKIFEVRPPLRAAVCPFQTHLQIQIKSNFGISNSNVKLFQLFENFATLLSRFSNIFKRKRLKNC